ncbi:MAG: sodium ion-translocating decarboxylase subunit beta [Synergistaceae bacterium]|nr:sodium ion-translocating decarboxylase subunit beta [Synergistaceae bacterium]
MEILFQGLLSLTWKSIVMFGIGGALIFLAVKKDYEPMLLLPIGFGAILVNLPFAAVWEYEGAAGVLQIFYNVGIETEVFPILIFVAVGAMIDFSPLLRDPKMLFLGAAAQFGIFATIVVVVLIGNVFPGLKIDLKSAAAIGVIGAADGPTSIFVAAKFAPQFLGPISVAAYSYMALVPIIQPPVIKLLTTKKERLIRMDHSDVKISKTALILFPITVTIISGVLAPICVPLVGMLMFGNLIRESGVLERLSNSAQNELANLVTLLLGITIGGTMHHEKFLQPMTLLILVLGLAAFVFDTAGGVLFVKFLNLFAKNKINPMVGAAGISAFPMSARIVQKLGAKEDNQNFLLMPAVSANVAGQVASAIAGGMVLAIVPWLLG